MDLFEARRLVVQRLIDSPRFGGSNAAFAKATGISPSYVTRMLKEPGQADRKRIGDDNALKIEGKLNLSPGEVLHPPGTGRTETGAALPALPSAKGAAALPTDDVDIHHWDTGGAMGVGVVLKDQPGVIQSWRVSSEWLQKNVRTCSAASNLCIVTGFGDSMRPMFNPGDPLLVDTGVQSVEFDAVYFFRIADEGFIKRLQRIPGEGIRVISANRDHYEPWTIKKGMDFQVFGRVLKVWCSEDF